MGACSQPSITDGAFAHLRGINSLIMDGCSQPSISDKMRNHLKNTIPKYSV